MRFIIAFRGFREKETPRLEEDRRGGYDREEARWTNKDQGSETVGRLSLKGATRPRHRRT